MKYSHIISEAMSVPWAIRPQKLNAIMSFLRLKADGGSVSAEDVAVLTVPAREPFIVEMDEDFRPELFASAVPHGASDGKDDSSSWDGAAARDRLASWASSDGSGDKDKIEWAKYRRGFAWYDSSSADSFGSYKLPHHDIKGGKFVVVLSGVEAAMGALLGGRGGTSIPSGDRKAVYNHLAAEYRVFGKEPPEYHSEFMGATFGDDPAGLAALQDALAIDPSSTARSRAGAIAVLPLSGTISHRMGMMSEMSGGTSTERFTGWLRSALNDPMVKSIVIDVDSPGGTVPGVPELADEIFQGRQVKQIVAVANAQAASAAYWLVSQASELVVAPSAEVGSIGVFAAHEDISKAAESKGVKVSLVSAGKYKTEANPFEPLSEEARQSLQAKVNEYYGQFTKAVARGRGVSQERVQSGFGEGRMVTAQEAVRTGMADRVATMDKTLMRMGAKRVLPKMPDKALKETAAASELPDVAAESARLSNLHRRQREVDLYQ